MTDGRVWIKICGCRRVEDAAAAAAAGADAFGLILAPGFRRSLDLESARVIRAAAPAGLAAVGVFVGQPATEVAAIADALGLDGLQFHGAGSDALCARFRGLYTVTRAWNLEGPEPVGADWLHLEPGAAEGGGRGEPWDWGRAASIRPGAPFILSGGLTPQTVAEACEAARPGGVDVSSGVETDGRKDPERMARFCAEVRRWEHGRAGGGEP